MPTGPDTATGRTATGRDAATSPKGLGKTTTMEQLELEVVFEPRLVPLEELSTENVPGWRDIHQDRVEELKVLFLRGECLKTIPKKASVRCFAGVPSSDDFGCKLIFDGKHTIAR